MKLNVRAALVAVGVVGLAALVLPASVDAQKVLNPGAFALQSTGGQVQIGGLGLDLTPRPVPQCSDGINNDNDTLVDALDPQCAAGPNGEPKSSDDSELAAGFQPKVNVSITGTIDKNGVVAIPISGVVFPPTYVPVVNPFDGVTYVVKAEVLATQAASGTINPLTGAAELNVRIRIKLSGVVLDQPLDQNCSIGTAGNPISLNLITGRKEAVPGGNGAITGSPYNSVTGNALLVDNAFAVPGATGCQAGFFVLDTAINDNVGIPSASGRNVAVLAGKTTPALARGISPVITSSVPLAGATAPFSVTLSGANSSVAAGPATYSWLFGDGSTATGEYVDKTFPAGNQSAKLTVTDADGDSIATTSFFTVSPGSGTTTTTASTTTASTTTASTTTTTTTTTQPPTTTTASTTTTTTTTQPPTTTTASTTTTTTTQPPTTTTASTTTTTTQPPPSDDSVDVRIAGAVNYANQGSGASAAVSGDVNGDVAVRRDSIGIVSVSGFLEVAGTQGGTARVTTDVRRAWILPLWFGQVSVRDQGAGVNITAPVFGQISGGDTLTSARGTTNWFILGRFPNLFRPYSLNWSVTDAG